MSLGTPIEIVEEQEHLRILSIDAGKEQNSWIWNNWYKVGTISKQEFEKLNTNIKLCRYMRDQDYLSKHSKGKIMIDDDQYNIVFCERNGKPLFAIEYGNAY